MQESADTAAPRSLTHREAHVWHIALDRVSPAMEMRSGYLSEEERMRSTLFSAPVERRRFIASRIVLRHIVAAYYGCAPADLPLAREPGGRPFIKGANDLHFSLSHSGDTALVVVADTVVGIDVERARRVRRAGTIARRMLHPETVRSLAELSPARRGGAFLDAWTQREAHVKAVGGGLFRTPDVLPFDPDQPSDGSAREVESREDGSTWSAARLRPHAAAHATVVMPGRSHGVRVIDWNVTIGNSLDEEM